VKPFDLDSFDLNRHAVIEASAGTGKTYTLERLVARLVRDEGVDIKRILVVTFTEKATSEMKRRIRGHIRDELRNEDDPVRGERLQEALDTFDRAAIYTIHSFCHRTLTQFAFENGQPFEQELDTGPSHYDVCFNRQLRTLWRTVLLPKLAHSPELAAKAVAKDCWAKIVKELARKVRREERVVALETSGDFEASACALDAARSYLQDTPAVAGAPASVPGDAQLEAACKLIAAERLRADVEAAKRDGGVIDYDDMITLVNTALGDGDDSNLLVRSLRRRYKVALVDEFQDTDQEQCSIFRKIFMGSDGDHRLIVIGDPKQSIYGWRGADLGAYFQARRAIDATAPGERLLSLGTCFRALPGMIEAHNDLFSTRAWFGEDAIDYAPVAAPAPDMRRTRLYADASGRAPFTIVDMVGAVEKYGQARYAFARFVSEEIERLLAGGVEIDDDGERRALRYADIAVLVRSRREAEPVMANLRRSGIPYSLYKQGGVYQSAEAAQLLFVLKALAAPDDRQRFRKALLSRFFGVALEELHDYDGMAVQHPVRQLFASWVGLCRRREWPRLFRSLMADTGLMYREAREADGERRVTNYQQVIEDLVDEAFRRNMDIVGLVQHFDLCCRGQVRQEETANLHRKETELPTVKILTMHVAKGLEFPVVFVAGGFSSGGSDDYYTYHDEEDRRVFDLITGKKANPAGNRLHTDERRSEDKRLYYVAVTRARYKVYVPRLACFTKKGKVSVRSAGPVTTVIYNALQEAWPEGGDGARVRCVGLDGRDRNPETPWAPALDAREGAQAVSAAPVPLRLPDADVLYPEVPDCHGLKTDLHSFTGLKKRLHSPPADADARPPEPLTRFGDESREDDEFDTAAGSAGGVEAVVHELPPGRHTGLVLHEVLELLDGRIVAAAEEPGALLADGRTLSLMQRALARHGISESREGDDSFYLNEVARLAWTALCVPLAALGSRLCDVPPEHRCNEIEFHFPPRWQVASGKWQRAGGPSSPDGSVVAGRGQDVEESCSQRPTPDSRLATRDSRFSPLATSHSPPATYIKGIVDVLVYANGRYFVLDWKTNRLDEYGERAVSRSMAESGYDLQYQLYSVALLRWLAAIHGEDADLSALFGGVYYLYLRGMDITEPQRGVFYREPAADDLRRCLAGVSDFSSIAVSGGEVHL